MPQVPAALDDCSTTERIAALLYLGWTHEEIAAATNVSKGTVQNRRTELEGGNLDPPPEAFTLVRTREREVHRAVRESGMSPAAHGIEIADRMSAIADLATLDIGPDGELSYEELVAFATLITGQTAELTPREVVKRLAPLAILVDSPPSLSESVSDSSTQSRAEAFDWLREILELHLSMDDDPTQTKSGIDDAFEMSTNRGKSNIDQPPQKRTYDYEQPDGFRERKQADQTPWIPSRDKILITGRIDREECRRRGGSYNEETGMCWLGPSEIGY